MSICNKGSALGTTILLLALLSLNSALSLSIPSPVIGQGGLANAICEANPTHLACNTSVAIGHALIQNLPAGVIVRPCSIFLASPHCCSQFCLPGAGGTCDSDTGACFCNPSGVPEVCQVRTDETPLSGNDAQVLEICRGKCLANPNGCTTPALATDGIVGTVCMCYCK